MSMKAKKTFGMFLILLAIGFVGCSDDADSNPITLKDREGTTFTLIYPGAATGYSYALQGGNGNYSVKSANEDVVKAEMTGSVDFRIKTINTGKTTVTITDNSQNTLVLDITVDYETYNFKIKLHDAIVIGDDLTTNEKKAIEEKVLADIPVKVGGGYKFIFTDRETSTGKAIIYTEVFGGTGIETTFEYKKLSYESGSSTWGYEIFLNNEKRLLFINRYYPSTKSDQVVPIALVEDVTEKIKREFPKVDHVGSFQVIDTQL